MQYDILYNIWYLVFIMLQNIPRAVGWSPTRMSRILGFGNLSYTLGPCHDGIGDGLIQEMSNHLLAAWLNAENFNMMESRSVKQLEFFTHDLVFIRLMMIRIPTTGKFVVPEVGLFGCYPLAFCKNYFINGCPKCQEIHVRRADIQPLKLTYPFVNKPSPKGKGWFS